MRAKIKSTTVEIILYYLTSILSIQWLRSTTVEIILYYLTLSNVSPTFLIYNSRNYSILLNKHITRPTTQSTTVEIILYYLTWKR